MEKYPGGPSAFLKDMEKYKKVKDLPFDPTEEEAEEKPELMNLGVLG